MDDLESLRARRLLTQQQVWLWAFLVVDETSRSDGIGRWHQLLDMSLRLELDISAATIADVSSALDGHTAA